MCCDSLARCCAGGVDALALALQHPRDGILGEPVDLEVGLQPAQLAGDRHVALGVAQADRRGDVERPWAAVGAVHRRVARSALAPEGILGEVAQRQVDLHRLAGVREVAGARHDLELAAGEAGQCPRVAVRRDLVAVSGEHQHRAVEALRQLAQLAVEAKPPRSSTVAPSVSWSVSSPHPIPSSMPLVEWGSEKHLEMNHSTNSG